MVVEHYAIPGTGQTAHAWHPIWLISMGCAAVVLVWFLVTFRYNGNLVTSELHQSCTGAKYCTPGPRAPHSVELGSGFIDYHPIFGAARRAGIEHAFVEQEGPFSRPELEAASLDYEFLASFS